MLTDHEKRFLVYWEANRLSEKKTLRQLMIGIPIGLLFAIPILVGLFSGKLWYKRADAVANAQINPVVLVVAVIIITAFIAIFYKRHQWDMKEQQYLEIKEREKRSAEGG